MMTKMLTALFAAATMTVVAATPAAHAGEARPPIGTWVGTFNDGSQLGLIVNANGNCAYGVPNGAVTVGTCSWNPSSVGGIITLTYYNAGFESHAYYSVTYLDAQTIKLSDPYFQVVMRRQ
jgi:hypothetical protein